MYGRDMCGWDISGRGICGWGVHGQGMHGFLSYPLVISGWDIGGRALARQIWAGETLSLTMM